MGLVNWFRKQFHIMSPGEIGCQKFVDIGNAMIEGMRRGIEDAETALASAPAIGERYWVILGKSHDLYSGEIAEHTWQNGFVDRWLCVFRTLYQSREEALRAKLLMIKEKRSKL